MGEAAVNAAALQPMYWGSQPLAATAFFTHWQREIAMHDLCFQAEQAADAGTPSNVYAYLIAKVYRVVNTVRAPGQAGWSFRCARPDTCIPCLVWADGTPGQREPLSELRGGEQWWPCIVIPGEGPLVPFYCPALAWANARPWMVHVSRIRRVVVEPHTPGAYIEEPSDDSSDSDDDRETDAHVEELVDDDDWEIIE